MIIMWLLLFTDDFPSKLRFIGIFRCRVWLPRIYIYIGILSGLWGRKSPYDTLKRSAPLRGFDRSAEMFIALRSWDFFIFSMHFERTHVTQCHVNVILGKLCHNSLTWIVRPILGWFPFFKLWFPGFGRAGFGRDEIYPDVNGIGWMLLVLLHVEHQHLFSLHPPEHPSGPATKRPWGTMGQNCAWQQQGAKSGAFENTCAVDPLQKLMVSGTKGSLILCYISQQCWHMGDISISMYLFLPRATSFFLLQFWPMAKRWEQPCPHWFHNWFWVPQRPSFDRFG